MNGFKKTGILLMSLARHKRLVFLLCSFFLAQLLAGAAIINFVSISQTKEFINQISQNAVNNIHYKDGRWDTAKYDSDPEIPGNFRIYIISKDGFIIDRWRPIPGYLDTSDYKQLLSFAQPKSIRTVTNQDWRILSVPISHDGNTVGVITTGYYGDKKGGDSEIDKELYKAADTIRQKVVINDSEINTQAINAYEVPFRVSYQVVDQYNKIHAKSDNSNTLDRLPNYIEPSYISKQLKSSSVNVIKSSSNGEKFLVKVTPLKDSKNQTVGTIIVARTMAPFSSLINQYLLLFGAASFLIIIMALVAVLSVKDKNRRPIVTAKIKRSEVIRTASFDKKHSQLIVNNHRITIAYATNQYYVCAALFSAPKKKWEIDELTEKLGYEHEPGSWRKVYDAVNSINKKALDLCSTKLIITNNKTNQINPTIVVKNK